MRRYRILKDVNELHKAPGKTDSWVDQIVEAEYDVAGGIIAQKPFGIDGSHAFRLEDVEEIAEGTGLSVNAVYAAILRHGLAIRQLPKESVEYCDLDEPLEVGDVVVHAAIAHKVIHGSANRHHYDYDSESELWRKKLIRRKTACKHPGWWMCAQIDHPNSLVKWDMDESNLAPTLAESVQMLLVKRDGNQHQQLGSSQD